MSAGLTCELSGEALIGGDNIAVVTPSGHVCLKRLLLQQLTTNGGQDPFETDRPLVEDDLVELKIPKVLVPPPRTSSFTHTLQTLQQDYDAILLELFDTRKLLSETRQELSQALYQNDAAVRVIARLSAEYEQARDALKSGKRGVTSDASTSEPATKKMKVVKIASTIPQEDFEIMTKTWEELHGSRKAQQKKLSKEAPSLEVMGKATAASVAIAAATVQDGAKTSLARSGEESLVHVSGTSLALIENNEAKAGPEISSSSSATDAAAFSSDRFLVGMADGTVHPSGLEPVDGSAIVAITAHPDSTHFVVATANGTVAIGKDKEWIAAFTNQDKSYTVGTLHPDGLIYIAGTASGSLDFWDFKSQSLGGSMDYPVGAVKAVAFSNNAYHIAAVYNNGHVLVWDLRKQSILTTLNEKAELTHVSSVVFDESGKYLAYSGQNGKGAMAVCVVTVKHWDDSSWLEGPASVKVARGLTWNKKGIAACALDGGNHPQVVQFNVPN